MWFTDYWFPDYWFTGYWSGEVAETPVQYYWQNFTLDQWDIFQKSDCDIFLLYPPPVNSGVPLFILGRNTATSGLNLFINNLANTNTLTLYINAALENVRRSIPLYLYNSYKSRNLKLYTRGLGSYAGSLPYGDSITLWIGEGNKYNAAIPLFCKTSEGAASGLAPLYTLGSIGVSSGIPLSMPNIYDTNTSNVDLYTHGL